LYVEKVTTMMTDELLDVSQNCDTSDRMEKNNFYTRELAS